MKPISNQLKQHHHFNPISLHVPGHHYGTIGHLNLKLKNDITEITGMDDYHHPDGIIKNSEALLYKAGYFSKFLVSGTTVGILSSIMGSVGYDDKKVAIMRNAHKSVFNALELCGKGAYILPMKTSKKTGVFSEIDLDCIKVNDLKEIGIVVITYPNYFGECFDIERVISFFHQHDILVIVDEAHGAHFNISDQFPDSATKFDADIVIQSYHKTLPALTMSSVVHIREDYPFKDNVLHYLTMLQSSSPSYLLMEGLESAHQFYLNYNDELFFERRSELIKVLKVQFGVIEVEDPLKLMIYHTDYKGTELQQILETQHIYTELSNENFVLFVLPLWHEGDAYLFDDLIHRLRVIKLEKSDVKHFESLYVGPGELLSVNVMNAKWLNVDRCIGYVVAQHIIPYPPGIPVVLKGEKINGDHIECIHHLMQLGIHIQGIVDGRIKVFENIDEN